ncbi:DUF5668 domain-containing protein [Ferrovibrio sp.]|nr:DUF5668 domain-containing protein [Ferrovibrio sp.]MBP7066544.1 hypothetical protein [Ferrovibrio sp.]
MVAPFILIGLGLLFLANNFDMLSLAFLRQWWPLILIVLGIGMLFQRGR